MRALDRIMMILDAVAAGVLGPTAVAQRTGLSVPTVARLMQELAEVGLLHRSESDAEYRLGPRLAVLARSAQGRGWLLEMALPVMQDLRDSSEETVSLHVPFGRHRVCLGSIEGPHAIRRVVVTGLLLPLDTGATGKALLSYLSEPTQTEYLAALAPEERTSLAIALGETRQTGYAYAVDAWIEGIAAVAAPVLDRVEAAGVLSISGPSFRWNESAMVAFAPCLVAGAAAVSEALRATRL